MLQSWEWGFRREYGGWGISRFVAMQMMRRLPERRSGGASPACHFHARGLVARRRRPEVTTHLMRRKQAFRAPFLRADPLVTDDKALRALGFRPSPQQIQPRATILVDLTRDDDAIMDGFDRQVRYNARHALKKGVEVSEGGTELIRFWQLLNATAERKGLSSAAIASSSCATAGKARVFLARYEGETVYGAVMARFGQRAYYLYGALVATARSSLN
jgi:hypothetical protein